MAKKDVVRFLVRMFGSPAVQENYKKDAEKHLKAAGLTPKERRLLLSADEEAIRAYLGAEAANATVVKDGLATVVKDATSSGSSKKR